MVHYLVINILAVIKRTNDFSFSTLWIFSYVGLPGNEKADELSKKNLLLRNVDEVKSNLVELNARWQDL